jgi:outer membrane biosynthesis protein TonB
MVARQPGLSGQLVLRATIDSTGTPTLVEVLEDSVHDEEVRACAYWNLKDAAYPPKKPGRLSFTWSFSAGR